MRTRLSPSLLVAVLALVLAASGVGYAAGKIGSAQIRDNSVQGRDIKNRTLTSADIKKKSLDRAVLDRSCRAGEVAAFGGCVRKASTGPSAIQVAIDDCSHRGGRILTLSELGWVAAHEAYVWADGNATSYEFSSDNDTVSNYTTAIDQAGNLFGAADGQLFWHHCLTY